MRVLLMGLSFCYDEKNTEAGDDMTQKERILNAKHCLDALALGLDPATGAELPDDSVLNRVELSRCFSLCPVCCRSCASAADRGSACRLPCRPSSARSSRFRSGRCLSARSAASSMRWPTRSSTGSCERRRSQTGSCMPGFWRCPRVKGYTNAPPDGAGAHHWPVGRGAQRKARHLHRYAVRAGGAALRSGQSRRNAELRVAAAGLTPKQILPKISIFLAFDWPAPLICGNIMTILTGNGESLCQNHRIRN